MIATKTFPKCSPTAASPTPADELMVLNNSHSSIFSLSPVFGTSPDDKLIPFEFISPKLLASEPDFLDGINPDDDIFRDMERALQEQKVITREAQMSFLFPPVTGQSQPNYAQGFSDTDSSSSAEMESRQNYADLLLPLETTPSVRRPILHHTRSMPTSSGTGVSSPARRKRDATNGEVKKRRRTKPIAKKDRALFATSSSLVKDASGSTPTFRTNSVVSSPAASKAEFERTIQGLSTPMLMCLIDELAGVREGKERVYIAEGARAPEQSMRDAVDGRAYIYKKVIPHQHKPERTGDPSPRCFACAARMMHERALANMKARSDVPTDKEYMSEENIKSARQLIINSLGLPVKTRVFEYELVGEPNHA